MRARWSASATLLDTRRRCPPGGSGQRSAAGAQASRPRGAARPGPGRAGCVRHDPVRASRATPGRRGRPLGRERLPGSAPAPPPSEGRSSPSPRIAGVSERTHRVQGRFAQRSFAMDASTRYGHVALCASNPPLSAAAESASFSWPLRCASRKRASRARAPRAGKRPFRTDSLRRSFRRVRSWDDAVPRAVGVDLRAGSGLSERTPRS